MMEALYGITNRERLAQLLLTNHNYEYGLERETSLQSAEIRERELLVEGYVSDHRIKRFAASRYPHDANLGSYTWETLLKDPVYFKAVHPGGSLQGRDYQLDVLHIASGQEREKWLIDGGNPIELLVPGSWAIGIMSLKNQHHKLYVHDDRSDGYNLCRDGFGHQNRGLEGVHLDKYLSRVEASIGLDEWSQQAKVQGVNPCIFGFIQRWALTLPSL